MSESRIVVPDQRRKVACSGLRRWTIAHTMAIAWAVGSVAQSGEVMPDFSRSDVNTASATYGEMVSPEDYQGKVSGWYFGYST